MVVSNVRYLARKERCNTCEHYRPSTKQCSVCGCFMFLKAKLAFARCPLGFWGTEHGSLFYYSVVKKFSNPPTDEDIKKFYEIKSELIGKKVLPECDACAFREIADFLRYCKEQMNDE